MFIAFICLERFSKFPALCMGRVGFVSAWLGSKQDALALLLWCRRNDSAVGVHRACEQWHVGHQQTCLQSKSEPRLGWGWSLPSTSIYNQLANTFYRPSEIFVGASSSRFEFSAPGVPDFCTLCSVVSVGLWAVTQTPVQLTWPGAGRCPRWGAGK